MQCNATRCDFVRCDTMELDAMLCSCKSGSPNLCENLESSASDYLNVFPTGFTVHTCQTTFIIQLLLSLPISYHLLFSSLYFTLLYFTLLSNLTYSDTKPHYTIISIIVKLRRVSPFFRSLSGLPEPQNKLFRYIVTSGQCCAVHRRESKVNTIATPPTARIL